MPTRNKRPTRQKTSLIMAASEGDSNMLYATGFFVPDPFIYFEHRGRKHVVMSDLEIDRAKKEADVDSVLSLSEIWRRLKRRGRGTTGTGNVLELIFKERGIRTLVVPSNFPVLLADDLRSRRFTVVVKKDPFFDEREKKSPMEVKKIQDSIRVA
ncbi:MAG: aminopeptidase P family protein, partial [Candidatus Binatia bacterium]